MVLQVTSNVGGTTATVPIDQTTPTPAAAVSTQTVPTYQIDFAGITRAATVGLSTPTAIGDFEIAFSRIASDLKDALNVLGDLNKVGLSQTRRAELANALAAFVQMVDWGQTIDDNLANITKQTGIKEEQTARKTTAEASQATLNTLRGQKVDQLNALGNDITTYSNTISALRTRDGELVSQRAGLDPTKDATLISQIDAERGQIPGAISYWEGQILAKQGERAVLFDEVDAIDIQLGQLQSTIDDAKGKISAAENSIRTSNQIIVDTKGTMSLFYDSTIILMKLLAGKVASEIAGDAGTVAPDGNQFDRLIAALASVVVTLGEELSSSDIGKEVAAGGVSGTGLNLDQSAPGRFGQPNATVARALAFAGIVAGVLGAVRDLLDALNQGRGMQSAESFANAGAARVRVGV